VSESTGVAERHICVIGLGNVLLGDDGFGPLVVERFRCEYADHADVEVLDLGTPGLDLAPYLHGKHLAVIVDTVKSEGEPGTLCHLGETDFGDRRAALHLTGHDPGLAQCLAQLRLAGRAPSKVIVVGVVPQSCALGSSFSAPVFAAVSTAVEKIASLLREHDVPCQRRAVQKPPNLWWETVLRTGMPT